MHISVISLDGVGLRYALGVALNMDIEVHHIPVYNVGYCILVKGQRSYFRPDKDWSQAGPLINEHWHAIHSWFRATYGDNWAFEIESSGTGLNVWYLRAIVGYYHGPAFDVPDQLV